MAKECINNCPTISALCNWRSYETADSGFIVIPSVTDIFLCQAIKDADNCPGPIVEEVPVKKGWWKPQTVMEERAVCGLHRDNKDS